MPGTSIQTSIEVAPYFLPGIAESDLSGFISVEFGSGRSKIRLDTPVVTQELITRVTENLMVARNKYLAKLPVYTIVEIIDEVVTRWLDKQYHMRRLAEDVLPIVTQYSLPMIQHGLDNVMSGLQKEQLLMLLEEEFGDPLLLDNFRPRGKTGTLSKAVCPSLVAHIFSGNIPGPSITSLVCALLVKSASLGKLASGEPILPVLFVRSIAEVDPALADSIAVLWWKGGEKEVEETAFERSDTVIAYGDDSTIESVRQRIPSSKRFIGYGHKISFGVIAREALFNAEALARLAAYDVSMFDQQGCLSPHLFYVETGGQISPRTFAEKLAEAMETLNNSMPMREREISDEEAVAVHNLRSQYEFREIAGQNLRVWSSRDGVAWTVIYEEDPTFVPSCLNRTVRVKPINDIGQVSLLVDRWRIYMQAIGVAIGYNRLLDFSERMGRLGVNRICPIGEMQRPPLWWHHDGRFNLLDLVRWIDIEGFES